MISERMLQLGTVRSVIRELYEYGRQRKKLIGEENVFDFSLGNPNVPCPETLTDVLTDMLKDMPPEILHGYTSAPGDNETRKAVADSLVQNGILDTDADHVYMTCGAAGALCSVFGALLGPGMKAAVLSPYFPEYKVFAAHAGSDIVEIPCDRATFQVNEEALRALISPDTAILIINTPNNPTGVVFDDNSLRIISSVLEEKSREFGHRIYLVSDEPYREITYVGKVPAPGLYYPHTVVCYSFSKSLSLPGERIGYAAVSRTAENAERLFYAICGAGRALGYVCAPALMQHAVPKMLRMTSDFSVYKTNRDLLYDGLTQMGYTCVPPDGAFYLFLRAPDGDGDSFAETAKRYELLLVPGRDFGSPAYVRIAYCVKTDTVRRSLPAFAALARVYGLKG